MRWAVYWTAWFVLSCGVLWALTGCEDKGGEPAPRPQYAGADRPWLGHEGD